MAIITKTFEELVKTTNASHTYFANTGYEMHTRNLVASTFKNYVGTDYILQGGNNQGTLYKSGTEYYCDMSNSARTFGFQFKEIVKIVKVNFDYKVTSRNGDNSMVMPEIYKVTKSGDTVSTGNYTYRYIVRTPSNLGGDRIDVSDGNYHSAELTWNTPTEINYMSLNFNQANRGYFKNIVFTIDDETITSNGGGATHIAKVTGQLKDLSSNLSDILMVSGGGGGGLLLGDSGWHGTEQNIAWSGNNNKLTVQLDDDDVLFKMYIGSSNIYSFTAPVSDINNIYLQFLIDSENEVAKPSFVYKNGSSYSFNQEEPTDAEMQDIYTWLSAGINS